MNLLSISAQAGITGFESPAAEYSQLGLSLDELLVEHPSSTFLARANGNSMELEGIFDQDILIIDRFATVKNHDIVCVNLNGEFACKIIDIENRMLISANNDIAPVAISETDAFSLEGVVVKSIRLHKPSHLLGTV